MTWWVQRIEEGRKTVEALLAEPTLAFDERIRSRLPEEPGLYAISLTNSSSGEFLRAGRAKGRGGLRQRLYQNHLMGDQGGNLRTQLVRYSVCADLNEAKQWIREHCVVQVLEVRSENTMVWAEHFMLSVLRPKYSD